MTIDVVRMVAVAATHPGLAPWVRMCQRAAAFVGRTTTPPHQQDASKRRRDDGSMSPLQEYVHRLVLLGPLDAGRQALVTATIFYDRAVTKTGGADTDCAQQRMFAAAFVLAAKLHMDAAVPPMSHFAAIAGVPVAELLQMELCFLSDLLGYDVSVSRRDFYLMARALGWDGELNPTDIDGTENEGSP